MGLWIPAFAGMTIQELVRRLIVRRAARENEAPVAIAAVDIALLVDLEIDARVAEGGAAGDFARAVAGDAGGGDSGGFGSRLHGGSPIARGRGEDQRRLRVFFPFLRARSIDRDITPFPFALSLPKGCLFSSRKKEVRGFDTLGPNGFGWVPVFQEIFPT